MESTFNAYCSIESVLDDIRQLCMRYLGEDIVSVHEYNGFVEKNYTLSICFPDEALPISQFQGLSNTINLEFSPVGGHSDALAITKKCEIWPAVSFRVEKGENDLDIVCDPALHSSRVNEIVPRCDQWFLEAYRSLAGERIAEFYFRYDGPFVHFCNRPLNYLGDTRYCLEVKEMTYVQARNLRSFRIAVVEQICRCLAPIVTVPYNISYVENRRPMAMFFRLAHLLNEYIWDINGWHNLRNYTGNFTFSEVSATYRKWPKRIED